MKTIKIKGKTVEIYDAIDTLPIARFHKYNKFLLIDAGIGSDIADFDRHIEKAMRYARSKTPQMAITELENLRQNVYFVQSEMSPRYMAFAALVKSIDGRPCADLSDEALKKIIDDLADVPANELTAELDAVKKKIDEELHLYFPRLFDDANVKEYFNILKDRTVLVLKSIIAGGADTKTEKEIDDLTGELIMFFNPQSFSGTESAEIRYDRQFENMCLIISQHLHVNPKLFTVLEYYNAFEYIQEEARKAKKTNKRK